MQTVRLLLLAFVPVLAACHRGHEFDTKRGPFLTLESVSAAEVTVSWDDTYADAKRLEMERRLEGKRNFKVIADLAAAAREFTDTSLDPGLVHRYRLRAYFSNQRTDRSVILPVEVPPAPVPLRRAPDPFPAEDDAVPSPDGRAVAWIDGGRVRVLDRGTDVTFPATDGRGGPESAFVWTADSSALVVAAGPPGGEDLRLAPLGEETLPLTNDSAGVADLRLAAGGAAVEWTDADGSFRILPLPR